MSHDAIDSWVQNAKTGVGTPAQTGQQTITVVRASPQNKGNMIMELSDKILPWLSKMLDGVRDNNGLLLQPAHVRGIALNVAQTLVNKNQG